MDRCWKPWKPQESCLPEPRSDVYSARLEHGEMVESCDARVCRYTERWPSGRLNSQDSEFEPSAVAQLIGPQGEVHGWTE
jgi:hypothetical protein